MPRVSVILTSFNDERFIDEAIRSVLEQTYVDFELIIWDDASSDNSWSKIISYSDDRIKCFRNEANSYATYGINEAILNVAQGEYIAIHHSDDVWNYEKLEFQVGFLDSHKRYGAVFTDVTYIDEEGQIISDPKERFVQFDAVNRTRYEWLNHFFYDGNSLCHPSVMVRKECFNQVGLYNRTLYQLPDFDFWIRLCMTWDIYIIQECLTKFRLKNNNSNTSAINVITQKRTNFELLTIMNNYTLIDSEQMFKLVFPSYSDYKLIEECDYKFALAMICLNTHPLNIIKLFGLTTLYEIMDNVNNRNHLREFHGFDLNQLFRLSGTFDVFSLEENIRLKIIIMQLQSYADNVDKLLPDLKLNFEHLQVLNHSLRVETNFKDEIIRSIIDRQNFDHIIQMNELLFCPVCKTFVSSFLPLDNYYKEMSLKYGFMYFGKDEMTNVDSYCCPNCGASDRERLYAYWLSSQRGLEISLEQSIIHFAPEKSLEQMLRNMRLKNYYTADLHMKDVDYNVDLTNLPFADEQFSFFICSHVLEHIENDIKAIQELYRITKYGGRGIVMVPVGVCLESTIEHFGALSEEDRWRLFGQGDHVRYYSHKDFVNRLTASGFLVHQLDVNYFSSAIFEKLDLKPTSILYVVEK